MVQITQCLPHICHFYCRLLSFSLCRHMLMYKWIFVLRHNWPTKCLDYIEWIIPTWRFWNRSFLYYFIMCECADILALFRLVSLLWHDLHIPILCYVSQHSFLIVSVIEELSTTLGNAKNTLAKTLILFLDHCLIRWKTYTICGKFIILLSSHFLCISFCTYWIRVVNKSIALEWWHSICQCLTCYFLASFKEYLCIFINLYYIKSSSNYT